MKIKLRKAGPKDSRDILSWRNDPSTRAVSFNTKEVTMKEHAGWFSKAIGDKSKSIYIGEGQNREKLGMVRLDKVNALVSEISVNIAPEMRGRGYGAALISLACKKAGAKVVIARTKENNLPSVKAFIKAGFVAALDYTGARGTKVKVLIRVKK